jgi:phage protein D
LDGETELNSEKLFYNTTGSKRSKKYFDTYPKRDDSTARSEDETKRGVSLAMITANMTDVAEQKEKEIERWVSQDVDFLMKRGIMNRRVIKKELKHLNDQLREQDSNSLQIRPIPNERGATNKAEYVNAVIEARKKLCSVDANWESQRREDKQQEQAPNDDEEENAEDFEKRRDETLDSPFFSFTDTNARASYSHKRHLIPFQALDGQSRGALTQPEPGSEPGSPSAEAEPDSQPSTIWSSPSTAGFGLSSTRRTLRNFDSNR